jgi:hypothetical protein
MEDELKPIPRNILRAMYAENLVRQRRANINGILRDIYYKMRGTAGSSTKTSYTHQFPTNIHIEYIPDILTELHRLFPDIKIEYTQLKTLNRRSGNMEVTGHVITTDWS